MARVLLDEDGENTLVLYGEQNAVRVLQLFFSRISGTLRLVIDAEGLQSIVRVKEYYDIVEDLVSRGVRFGSSVPIWLRTVADGVIIIFNVQKALTSFNIIRERL